MIQDKKIDPKSRDYNASLAQIVANYQTRAEAAQAIQNAAQKSYNEGRLNQSETSRMGVMEGKVQVGEISVGVRGTALMSGQFVVNSTLDLARMRD